MTLLSRFGISHFSSLQVRDLITRRVTFVLEGGQSGGEAAIVVYPYFTPDSPNKIQWAVLMHIEGAPEPWVAPATLIVGVDRIIDNTLSKLKGAARRYKRSRDSIRLWKRPSTSNNCKARPMAEGRDSNER